MRPGYLRSTHIQQPKRSNRSALGAFGKGMMAPPPSAVPLGAAIFKNGKWTCDGPEPPPEADGYWTCCPSGWKKTPFSDTKPCKGEEDLVACGPLPEGMDISQAKCCANKKQWITVMGVGGGVVDPCTLPGQQGPLTSETILAPELEIERGPVVTPKMMIAGSIVAISLIGLAILAR